LQQILQQKVSATLFYQHHAFPKFCRNSKSFFIKSPHKQPEGRPLVLAHLLPTNPQKQAETYLVPRLDQRTDLQDFHQLGALLRSVQALKIKFLRIEGIEEIES